MLFGFVGADGTVFPPKWVKTPMDVAQYKGILIRKVFPLLDATYGKGNYVWTQDGASCHTAKCILNYLSNRLGSNGYWSKGVWPPNSYNLNPLDFSIWRWVEFRACNMAHTSKERPQWRRPGTAWARTTSGPSAAVSGTGWSSWWLPMAACLKRSSPATCTASLGPRTGASASIYIP